MSQPHRPLAPGDALDGGRYVVLERLGAGGFGTAYRAHDRGRRGGLCVIKQLVPKDGADARVGARFEREADALATLNHPAIPVLYHSFAEGGAYYIVQQYVEGRTLWQEVQSNGRLRERRARALLDELLAVLQYLHEHDPPIVHRDISPRNVMLDRDGRVRLIDFGGVRDAVAERPRRSGVSIVGTPGFMAFAQEHFGYVRSANDLYAAGAVALFAVTGKNVAEWEDEAAAAGHDAERPWVGRAAVSAGFEDVLAGLLTEPEPRFRSAREGRAALRRGRPRELAPGSRALRTTETPAEAEATEPRRRRAEQVVERAAAAGDPLEGARLLAGLIDEPEPSGGREALAGILARLEACPPPTAHLPAWPAGDARLHAFSPDGTQLLVSDDLRTALIWPVAGGDGAVGTDEPRVLWGHTAPVTSAAFSPDGVWVVTASVDGTARVWRSDGSEESRVLRGHTRRLTGAAFSPDGRHVVTASEDHTARVWRADGGGEPVVLQGHTDVVTSAMFSPDGRRVLTASVDGTACLWSANGLDEPLVLRGHADRVSLALFSPDGARVATASNDRTVRLWRSDTGAPLAIHTHPGCVASAAFSPDGARIAAADGNGRVRLWRVDGGADPLDLAHEGSLHGAAFSRDGARLVVACRDGATRVWHLDGPGEPVALSPGDEPVRGAAFSSDGSRIAAASSDGAVRVWRGDGDDRWAEPRVLRRRSGGRVTAAAVSPDGTRMVVATADATVHVLASDGAGTPVTLRGHVGRVLSAGFSADGARVVTASTDGTARLWPAHGAGAPLVLRGHAGAVRHAAMDAGGARVVTASDDGTARVYRADGSGDPVILRGHEGPVTSAAFSADGARIVTASGDGTARVWPANGAGEPAILRGHTEHVASAAFDPTGVWVVTASWDGTARVWPADGSAEPMALRGHAGRVTGAGFSPDGARLWTTSVDGTIRLWRADGSGAPIVLRAAGSYGRPVALRNLSVSRDGTRVVMTADMSSPEGAGHVFAWPLGWEAWLALLNQVRSGAGERSGWCACGCGIRFRLGLA